MRGSPQSHSIWWDSSENRKCGPSSSLDKSPKRPSALRYSIIIKYDDTVSVVGQEDSLTYSTGRLQELVLNTSKVELFHSKSEWKEFFSFSDRARSVLRSFGHITI
ncbi:hypothetical protein KIN20_035414 [Parelaphostrongylus tenuis]|uniref:Uncharacterized protein n=1 Tax=Parelaphostrongylus tenuis TaxID=148309 RepID=A0AAD5WJP1_PARTN|nr:hypothetical protein KIN20_035414 [Parelaphostrongylus tenuis]